MAPPWKRTLFVLLISFGTTLEVARDRLRAYETAFAPEEVEELLRRSGFEIIKGEFALATKMKNSLTRR